MMTTEGSKVCGIDYSMTSPAFCIYDGSTFNINYLVARDSDLVLGRETSETLNPKLYPKYDEGNDIHMFPSAALYQRSIAIV